MSSWRGCSMLNMRIWTSSTSRHSTWPVAGACPLCLRKQEITEENMKSTKKKRTTVPKHKRQRGKAVSALGPKSQRGENKMKQTQNCGRRNLESIFIAITIGLSYRTCAEKEVNAMQVPEFTQNAWTHNQVECKPPWLQEERLQSEDCEMARFSPWLLIDSGSKGYFPLESFFTEL